MPSPDKINEYAASVVQQIRWKNARLRVSEEITNHIVDGRDSYIVQGFDEQTATDKAIADTGDSITLGAQLDRIHRPKPQWDMFLWVAGFLLLGVLLSQTIFPGMDVPYSRLPTRLIWLAIGTVFMFVAYFADFSILAKYPRRIFIVVTLLTTVAFFFIPAQAQWISMPYLGSIQFHNITLAFPVILVPIIYTARNKGYGGLIISLLAYAFFCLATAISLAAFAHFAPVGISLIILAIMRGWFGVSKLWGSLLVIVAHIAVFIVWLLTNGGSFVFHRIMAIINPYADPLGRGFFPIQVRRLLNSAVLLGEGTPDYLYDRFWPMNDMQQMLYSDNLLTVVIFRFGWLVFAAIMCALIFFIAKAIARCFKQKSSLGFFVSFAITMTFAIQVLTYVIFNMGFSVAFISLPLISPGNAAIVVNMVLIGFMLSIFRTGDAAIDKKISSTAKQNDFLSWDNGKLTINFKMKAE